MVNLKEYYTSEAYQSHQYSGIIGRLMRKSHECMEFSSEKKSKVLEIGAGTNPHLPYLKHDFNYYYIIDLYKELETYYHKFDKVIFKQYDGKVIPFEDNYFDRIIISHCLEHIPQPESFLLQTFDKLKKNGNLSIALPTDPGVLWRVGRKFGNYFINPKTHKMTNLENDYLNAIDHVNSIFSLRTFIRKHFGNNLVERFEPLKFKAIDINLFYIAEIIK